MLSVTNTPATDLRNAALVIEQGWVQGAVIDERTGRVCALGAVRVSTGGRLARQAPGLCCPVCTAHRPYTLVGGDMGRYNAAVNELARLLPYGGGEAAVARYNDTFLPASGGAEYMARLMRRAADRWEYEHAREAREVVVAARPVFRFDNEPTITAAEILKMVQFVDALPAPAQKELALAGGPSA